jgi:hypothetical protein
MWWGLVYDIHNFCTIYLERRRNTLRDDQAALTGTLRIVVDHKITRNPNTIRILCSTDRVFRHSPVTGQRRMDDSVAEGNVSTGNGQGPEKSRILGAEIVDSHRYGFVWAMLMWRSSNNNRDEKRGISSIYGEQKQWKAAGPPFCIFFPC